MVMSHWLVQGSALLTAENASPACTTLLKSETARHKVNTYDQINDCFLR